MSKMDDENSNSSESSSDSDDDTEKELVNRARQLEDQLSTNKYLYDSHVEVIDIYRKLADLNSMREAYQRFHQCFPLTPKIWLEWIKDEIQIANTKEEQQQIFDLFDEAVEDYLSVHLWIEYAQYSIGKNDIQTTRAILERGLTAAGLHVSEGSLLWDTLRELELAHISLYQEKSEEWCAQVKRVAEIFKRQLSVPLLEMENTYHEWKEWYQSLPEDLVDAKPIEWGYKKALQTLEIYKSFEDRLLSAENDELHDIYQEYIKEVKDISTVLCLYERAVVPLCLTVSLWEDYIKYAFKLKEVVLKVTARAVRNCTWSEHLWIARIRTLEYHKLDEKDILTCFEQGVLNISPTPPLDLWFSFLEYYNRNSEDIQKLNKLFFQALDQISSEHDPTYKLSRWYARLAAKRGDMELARKIWKDLMRDQQNKGSVNAWLEYANLEKQYGQPNQVRNIFKKALSSCKDWPQYISEEWLMFERDIGNLEDIIRCEEKCRDLFKVVNQYVEKPIKSRHEDFETNRKRRYEHTETTERGSKRKFMDRKSSNQKREYEDDFNFKKLKVSHDANNPSSSKPIENKDPKTTVFISNLHPSVNEQKLKDLFPNASNINLVLDKKGKSRCFGYVQFVKEEECMTALARDRTPIDGRPLFISELKSEKTEKKSFKYSQTSEENKLFVKGLPVTKSKEDVEEIFKIYNPVEVRLIYKKNGQSKGIAYVEFKSPDEAKKALKECHSMKIDEHEIMVAISAPPPKKTNEKSEPAEPIRHARSRLQVPMMPRTLMVKKKVDEVEKNGKEEVSNKESKSNADFRNMFLNK